MINISNVNKKGVMAVAAVIILVGCFFAYQYLNKHSNLFNKPVGVASAVPTVVKLPGMPGMNETSVNTAPVFAVSQVKKEDTGTLRVDAIAWNAQIGAIFANGGPDTASGSLMDTAGVKVHWGRQDDYSVQQANLVKFAEAYSKGDKDPSVGSHFVVFMGDAGPSYMTALQSQLEPFNLHAVIIGAPGFSAGEDKCMGKAEWKKNPDKAKGKTIAAVIRDGDFNICLVWAQMNGIKINPDPTTFDPDALNFWSTSTFTDAGQLYITGMCEERKVVGSIGTRKTCVEGVATWTPGDVTVVEEKGGLVSLLSTKENKTQMAATVVGIQEWMHENPATTTNFLQAALAGGVFVAADPVKLNQAGALSAKTWKEQNGAYWVRYYKGVTQKDPTTGESISLGGSQAIGLASNLQYFMPGDSGESVYGVVYNQFCTLYTTFYPTDLPKCTPATDVVDTYFLEKIQEKAGVVGTGDVISSFSGNEDQVVAQRAYSINFAPGSDDILPSSESALRQILSNATTASNLGVRIEGYTSSEGGDAVNVPLSERRANAVLTWLKQHAPNQELFSDTRVRAAGYGSADLVRDSAGRENAVASRRVVVKFTEARK